ncbi:MAG TPA: F0F1 ATP synthase subunit delta [Sphingomonadaceae bacterium]|nr:F0F1 ATP synthase subunit delta [Sphingomonadaceae bacterium]
MENSGGIGASLAGRYAIALFDLAREDKEVDGVTADLGMIRQTLDGPSDFRELTTSPLLSRDLAARAVDAAAASMGLGRTTTKFLGVLAANRRLGQLPAIIRAFRELAARHRGEMTAHVTSAHALDDDQVAALRANLRTRFGTDVAVEPTVNPDILGGLIVQVGSQMIDGSIRTKLNTLAAAMKG